MKKIILFIAAALAMAGCKEKDKGTVENVQAREASGPSGSTLTCSENVIVLRNKFSSLDEYKAWVEYNKFLGIVCASNTIMAKIDLDQYKNDPDNIKKSIWLEANASFIDMDASSPHTVNAHVHDAPDPDNLTYVTIEFGELVNRITKDKYDNDMYNSYIEIKPDITNNTISVDTIADYDPAKKCLSIPFFRSIKKKYDIKDDTLLYFTTLTTSSKSKLLFKFKTALTSGNFIYFDMTDNPRKKGPVSPL